jgi:hypothetical protein
MKSLLAACFMLLSCSVPEDGGDVLRKRRFTFTGLHGVISLEIELHVATAVRSSNPTVSGNPT